MIAALFVGVLPASAQDAGAEPDADVEAEIRALRDDLRQQREELDEQRRRIERQKRALEAQQAPSAAAGAEAEEDAQLETLLGEVSADDRAAGEVQAFEPSFDLYGFADMGLQRFWGTRLIAGIPVSDELTFVMGNVNVYFDAKPLEDWRMLAEVRFSLLPHGADVTTTDAAGTTFPPIDNTVRDPTSPSGGFAEFQLGSIIMERAHIDYTWRDFLNVRLGLFLTPFGIYNVDHGTPTLIMANFPQFFVAQLFPQRQLGLELYGRFHVKAWELSYSAYVSNGRMQGQVDLTDDKAAGFRLASRTTRPIGIQLGLSGYVGSFEQGFKQVVLGPGGVGFERVFTTEYNEYVFGADLSLDVGGLRIQAEGVLRYVFYEEGKRIDRDLDAAADRSEFGSYIVAAYRLPWLGLEPFVEFDFIKWPTILGEGIYVPSAGLNVHFNPATVLKLQYSRIEFFDFSDNLPPRQDEHLNVFVSRLAIAF